MGGAVGGCVASVAGCVAGCREGGVAGVLRAEAARLRESLFRLNFKLALGEVDAVKRIRQEKKALARIETISRQGRN